MDEEKNESDHTARHARLAFLGVLAVAVLSVAGRSGRDSARERCVEAGSSGACEVDGYGADVVLSTVIGGGHTWPNGNPALARTVGEVSTEIDSSTIWEFLSRSLAG